LAASPPSRDSGARRHWAIGAILLQPELLDLEGGQLARQREIVPALLAAKATKLLNPA
jgi:hypothetical protein